MPNKTKIYQEMVEDVIAGGLLEDDEIEELRDLIARVERKMRAKMPAAQPTQAAE
jgi:coenzyme F420-reducing hydrogenase beta subunit